MDANDVNGMHLIEEGMKFNSLWMLLISIKKLI